MPFQASANDCQGKVKELWNFNRSQGKSATGSGQIKGMSPMWECD